MTEISIDKAFELAVSHHVSGRLSLAMELYQSILQAEPDHFESLRLLGVALMTQGRLTEALDLLHRSISIFPNNPLALCNLGALLLMLGQTDQAISALQQSINLDPQIPENYNLLGNAFRQKGLNHQAVDAFRQAIALRDNFPEAHHNLGAALHQLWRLDEAIACYQRAIGLSPNLAASHNNLGNAFKDQGRLKEAVDAFNKAILYAPQFPDPYSNLILAMQYSPEYDDDSIRKALNRWSDALAEPAFSLIRPHNIDPNPDRPLRIGFVSPDFRSHPVGRLMIPLLEKLNPARCLSFCYYDHSAIDSITNACMRLAKNWRSIQGLNDDQAADLIRQDRIDILIDLTSHTGRNRLLLFARKPAPVQVTWLAYCGSTGLKTIDYRLSDFLLDPPDSDLSRYIEKTEHLDTYWCYPAPPDSPEPGALPCLQTGHVTFGCFNNLCKISNDSALAWRQILKRLPNSRLILYAHEGTGRDLCRKAVAGNEIDPSRIESIKFTDFSQYLKHYQDIDIALDPFPYNGGVTTCDALWMGVPVVSLIGARAVSRAGFSLLTRVGLPELAGHSTAQYIQTALDLANDIPRLSNIRKTLRDAMLRSPLMNSDRFAENMENTLLKIWKNRDMQ